MPDDQHAPRDVAGPAGAIECAIDAPDGDAARRRRDLPSAPAARRHDGQQGRADAGARLRAARLSRGALQLPRRRRLGGRSGTTAAGEVDDALAVVAAFRGRGAAAGCWRVFRSAAMSRRRARRRRLPRLSTPQRLVLVGPATSELRRAGGAGRHAGDPRRSRRRGAAGGHARLGAAAGAAGGRRARASATSSTASCRCSRPRGAALVDRCSARRVISSEEALTRCQAMDRRLRCCASAWSRCAQAPQPPEVAAAQLPADRPDRQPGAGRARRRRAGRPGLADQADDGLRRLQRAPGQEAHARADAAGVACAPGTSARAAAR